MACESWKRAGPSVRCDPYVNVTEVAGLNSKVFDDYLCLKKVALVFFYKPSDENCDDAKQEFIEVSTRKNSGGKVFAAVDCSKESKLCSREQICSFPFFKLYMEGEPVARISEYEKFDACTMGKFVDHAEIIKIPDTEDSPKEKCLTEALWSLVHNMPNYLGNRCLLKSRNS